MDTVTTFTSALKETYSSDLVQNMILKKNPFFAMLAKKSDFVGLDYYRVPIIVAPGAGVSTSFTRANVNSIASANVVKDFHVTRTKTYSLGVIDGELFDCAQGKASSFIEASKLNVENVINNLARDLGISLYRSGWGTRGRLSSTVSIAGVNTLTLDTISDSFNFEIGQRLAVAATEGAASAKPYGSSTNPLIVTKVNNKTGVLTFGYNVDDATNGVPTISASDYLFLDGDVQATMPKVAGLASWLPDTDPGGSDSFFGVNRSISPTRLGGIRIDATGGGSLVEILNEAAAQVLQVGGSPDTILMSFGNYTKLMNTLEGKVQIVDNKKEGVTGFRSLELETPAGTCKIVGDINCDQNHMYVLQLNTWKLCTLRNDIQLLNNDGLELLRLQDYDAYSIRYRFSGNLACMAPGWNCSVRLA